MNHIGNVLTKLMIRTQFQSEKEHIQDVSSESDQDNNLRERI